MKHQRGEAEMKTPVPFEMSEPDRSGAHDKRVQLGQNTLRYEFSSFL
jgi:hypothetical protein